MCLKIQRGPVDIKKSAYKVNCNIKGKLFKKLQN